jgi:hypothetical protein
MSRKKEKTVEEILDWNEVKILMDWETFQELAAAYPELKEELLRYTKNPK